MRNYLYILILLFISGIRLQAQPGQQSYELNATVTVNSDRIQSSDKSIYPAMQRSINDLINGTKWSAATFAFNERIDCTFLLTIMDQPSQNSFKAELYIQARRPVYNSTYVTSIFNYRDKNVEFDYVQNAPLQFVQTTIDNNLVAIIAFYCDMILASDFDSFSSLGGSSFYRDAQSIATQAQSNTAWTGWSAFDDNKSRSSIVNAYLDESVKPFRQLWYTYHLKGLDAMAANPDRGRTTILEALPVLKDVRSVRNTEILLQMFADCKLDEIVSLASKANEEEKSSLLDLLRNVFPASTSQMEPLKK